ncbi:S6 family peptidase [Helicobacter sp. 23-1045]
MCILPPPNLILRILHELRGLNLRELSLRGLNLREFSLRGFALPKILRPFMLRRFALIALFCTTLNAQSINISNFYYRDYLDFGQNKGVFKEANGKVEITGKNGATLTIPNVPNFYASSNYGSITSIGRGFVVTANHVSNFAGDSTTRTFGLTNYTLAKEDLDYQADLPDSISLPYGRDEKFARFNKYIVEGQIEMLNIENSIDKDKYKEKEKELTKKEETNQKAFNEIIGKLADNTSNKVYIYQAGSGTMALRDSKNPIRSQDLPNDGSMKGGGFGYIPLSEKGNYGVYYGLVEGYAYRNVEGITLSYNVNGDENFNNRITTGDSGSGLYAYDSTNQKWVLVGVTSRATMKDGEPSRAENNAEVSFVSKQDLQDYQKKFEQPINLKISEQDIWKLNGDNLKYDRRGDTPNQNHTLGRHKDIIFSGGGTIEAEKDIDRTISGNSGGFVFADSASATSYKFTNKNGQTYSFKGSGLDIGENNSVEWHLTTQSGDNLHKIGKGDLVVKSKSDGGLKIGEGKVVLDGDGKAFKGIYITSGRGSLEVKNMLALGAESSVDSAQKGRSASATQTFTLKQDKNDDMGFYFGTGGGTLDLGGNNLVLNTIAANDKNAVITNSKGNATLTIEGYGYKETSDEAQKSENGKKDSTKANTIIHASIGEVSPSLASGKSTKSPSLAEGDKGGGLNPANIDISYTGNRTAQTQTQTQSKRNVSDKSTFSPTFASGASILSPSLASGDSLKLSPSLAEGDLGGGFNAQNISSAQFSNSESTHPLAPSAREGGQSDSTSAREGGFLDSASAREGGQIDSISAREGGQSDSTSAINSVALQSRSTTSAHEAHLIFDGNINTSGKLTATNANIALQGHATAHAIVSDENLRTLIENAEKGTQKPMPDYMDLSKPSTLNQPDWDNRTFKFGTDGIVLDNSNLTLGRNATLESDITASNNSKITFGSNVTHFIDNKDGANITGSGFSYYQVVESGNLDGEALKGADDSITYKGKITANGGAIQSKILDFNASLDLKDSAKLEADYLTINDKSTIKLSNGASAKIKTLKLDNISNANLSTIFSNGNNNPKLKVTERVWFENTSDLTLSQLDSANIKATNYDIWATKSSVNDTTKEVTANISLFEESNFSLKSVSLGTSGATKGKSGAESTQKNSIYLQGNTGENFTKLNVGEKITATSLDSAKIELRGKSEISAKSIEFDSVKDAKLILDKEAKLTGESGKNANIEVKGTDSKLNIYLDGEKKFDLNAQGGSKVTLGLIENASSLRASEASVAIQSAESAKNTNATFSGKITAKDSSIITTALDSITASVDLQGSASLIAKNINLDATHSSISLKGSANLTAEKITANNVGTLTLTNDNSATANVDEFIFSGGTTNLTGDKLIGKKITLKNSSIVKKSGDLKFSADTSIVTMDSTSKLEVSNLKVESGNLTLNFNDSTKNADKLAKIEVSGGSVAIINEWDFGNKTAFSSNGGDGKIQFQNAKYASNGSGAKSISANSTINWALELSNVGKTTATPSLRTSEAKNLIATTQGARDSSPSAQNDNKFESLKFSGKNLTLGADSTIKVTFDSSVTKDSVTLGQYYTLISSGGISDNRANKIIDFNFSGSEKLFVTGKIFDGKDLKIKFTQDDPKSFSELVQQIEGKYSAVLQALTSANPNDSAIELSANTDDYTALNARLQSIDSALNEIAQGNKTLQTRNLLFSNEQTINTRISQVRLNLAQRKKPLYFAQSDTLYRLQKLQNSAVASDAMPSFRQNAESKNAESNLPNSAWASVGGGYFGGGTKMGFGATNVGYDRIINAENADVMVGAMLGVGGYKAGSESGSDSATFYNAGIYLHSIFDVRGGSYGGHEILGSLNFSFSDVKKSFSTAQNAESTALGANITAQYKYNFIISDSEKITHALKPIALLSFGYNYNGAWSSAQYEQGAYHSTTFAYGAGVEYNAVMSESFYSVQLALKDNLAMSGGVVGVTLKGAKNFIGYSVESAPRLSFELNMIGSHKLTNALYLQYGIALMADTGANYGAKGDVKVGYKF